MTMVSQELKDKAVFLYMEEKLEEIGKWRFALTYLSMTDKQRDEMLSLVEDL